MNRSQAPARSLLACLLGALVLPLAACGGGGSGSGVGGESATVSFAIHDAPLDDLFAFQGDVVDLRLRFASGGTTANLLPGDGPVEFVGLQDVSRWLGEVQVPAGSYDAVVVGFAPGSLRAKAMDGSAVDVDAQSHQLVAQLPETLNLGPNGRRVIDVDLDLFTSLSGDVSDGAIDFAPDGTARETGDGSEARPIDEFRGIVLGASIPQRTVTVRGFLRDDLDTDLGEITVFIGDDTVLVDVNNEIFDAETSFFASLVIGKTLVEVHGELRGDGAVRARKIEIEDQAGGAGMPPVAVIAGTVLETFGDDGFRLLIREVVRGADVVEPVLEALGNPASIRVGVDEDTLVFVNWNAQVSKKAIDSGQSVRVEFRSFVQEPFPASEVEIRNLGAEVQGEIVDTTGLPDSFVMKVHESDFSLACGKVADKHTPLVVQLGPDTDVFLKTHEEPRIEPELLVVGLRVHVKGLLGGTPEAPTLDADRVRVRAGRFDKGVVVEIDPATHSFRAEDGVLKDDFGGAVDSVRDVWVEILPETFFTKDASSEAGLYEAFETLEPDEYLEVRVFGLGDALEDFVRAYEIRAHVRHENGQDDDEGKDDEDDDDDDDEDDD